jgi:hypothetical protein
MIVSSRLKRGLRAIGEICCPVAPPASEASGRLKPKPAKLNETATAVAEWVHNREITVIPGVNLNSGHPADRPDRLPSGDVADISAAIPKP